MSEELKHDRIWLHDGDGVVSWCEDKIDEEDVEYIRAALAAPTAPSTGVDVEKVRDEIDAAARYLMDSALALGVEHIKLDKCPPSPTLFGSELLEGVEKIRNLIQRVYRAAVEYNAALQATHNTTDT